MKAPSQESLAFLEALLSTPSPVSWEAKIQRLIREHMEPHAHASHRDVHGNQWFVLNPDAKLRVMLSGHVDEIAMMLRYIDDQGFLWVTRLGGIDPLMLWGRRVWVHGKDGPVFGVIGKRPIHNTPPEERTKGAKIDDIFIDIGAKDKKEALKRVRVGDPVTLTEGFQMVTNDLAIARAMDDRIGAFVVMEAFKKVAAAMKKKRKLDVGLYAVGSVQEEVGLRGAQTAAYAIEPLVGIAVDVGFATDFPSENKKLIGDFKLGGGPLLHRGPNINNPLAELMEGLCERKKIPYQLMGDGGITGTDAGVIQVSRAGVATALVGIPNRYMHSPVEMVSLADVEHAAELLAETALSIKEDMTFVP
ncbi:MAG: M42 family metallopeptidase [Planctomycetes bacterium]|nr:M42 family metallopeptidase [Planctomycetota bacterium]